jgi:hypothetical protein
LVIKTLNPDPDLLAMLDPDPGANVLLIYLILILEVLDDLTTENQTIKVPQGTSLLVKYGSGSFPFLIKVSFGLK